ncbi:hypothetical protein AVEN_30123-1 [Araneus ventricosus]|uniref:Uncharacterized protein n=1 Tax=Araneus ventricosus TaxID=182803 RepID=A0A4Y2WLX5_ARAVE|nr:hypothetical protein AVEN_30123-1 [Araneus ventricosus]
MESLKRKSKSPANKVKVFTQIAILVRSNPALQICNKFDLASLKQVTANELVTTRQICHRLAASNSLQTIAKTEYEDSLRFEFATTLYPNLSS